ncbi:MAG: cyclomaltodextrinase C-terminal domain-containing protein [Bacteroidia bacterium]|nr:cyclomaltodextrinase C-terminal domain-containing protein [Bacteroidia bacterium]
MAPSHWYVGFKDTLLEIIINAENIDLYDLVMDPYDGVMCYGKINSGNRHIAYLQVVILPHAKPGSLHFTAKPISRRPRYVKQFSFNYELLPRTPWKPTPIDSRDVLYRVILDRFANGDEGNDNAASHNRTQINRADALSPHGGDLKGLFSHIDYIKSIGVSTVWFNPIQLNDHSENNHLGYNISNHYKTDPRLGTNEYFLKITSELRKKGLKTIMDINPNDFSSSHWLYQNFDTSWFNNWDTFLHPDFTSYSINDPYYSPWERVRTQRSWINSTSPDVNQDNPHMARYLDQMYMWWMEYAGLNGYCINRVSLINQDYLNHLIALLQREFPNSCVITDTKTGSVAAQASMVRNNILGFQNNNLASIPDYHLYRAFRNILNPESNLDAALSSFYTALSDDILYINPELNLTFIDNSLEKRAFDQAQQNLNRWKMTCALLFTMRGIPVLYYGSEILLPSATQGPLPAQTDFPGGWKYDASNKFNPAGRNAQEQMAWEYINRLITFRTNNPVLANGKLMQYPVEKGIYVYFRYDDKSSVMVIANANNHAVSMDFKRFSERLNGYNSYSDIINKGTGFLNESISLDPGQTLILKLY